MYRSRRSGVDDDASAWHYTSTPELPMCLAPGSGIYGSFVSFARNYLMNEAVSNQLVSKDEYLDDMMDERESLLIRLGRLEEKLISGGRLKLRTKPPRRSTKNENS